MLSYSISRNTVVPLALAAIVLLFSLQPTPFLALFLLFLLGYFCVALGAVLFGRIGLVIGLTATVIATIAVIISLPLH